MTLCLFTTRPGRHVMGYCISRIWSQWNVRAADRIMRQHPGLVNRMAMRQQLMLDQVATMVANNNNQNQNQNQNQNRIGQHTGFEVTFAWMSSTTGNDHHNNHNNNNTTNTRGREMVLRAKTYRYNNKTTYQVEAEDDLLKQSSEPSNKDTDPTISTGGQEDTHVKDIHDGEDDDESSVVSSTELVFCPICHTEIEEGDRVGDLPCNHIMHIECLKTWIVRRNVCPLCMAEDIATPRQEINSTSQQTYDDQGASIPYISR
jgi:Ring finger domain